MSEQDISESNSTNGAPVWFITGCSTGFGRELARIVLRRGLRAVVTARDPGKVEDLVQGNGDRALSLPLDVTDPEQVRDAVNQAEERFGRIDVLVNNAGYAYYAAVEEGEENEARAMFDTNVFGLLDVVRAVLPGMRERGSGHIVNMSSVGGLIGLPGSGYYAATKFAVEGASEALSAEVSPLGIGVLLVEPGPFRTDFAGRSLRRSQRQIPDYAETAGARIQRNMEGSGKQPGDPERAAEAIVAAVESDHPPLRLPLGGSSPEAVRGKLRGVQEDIDAWEKTTINADYPEG